jgi:hypothetical protein
MVLLHVTELAMAIAAGDECHVAVLTAGDVVILKTARVILTADEARAIIQFVTFPYSTLAARLGLTVPADDQRRVIRRIADEMTLQTTPIVFATTNAGRMI